MGVEVAIIGAVASVASTVSQARQAKKAQRAVQEGQEIQGASEQVQNRLARRRAARETRLNRARLLASSENGGVTGSSGQMGAGSALSSNYGNAVAQQTFQTKTAGALSGVNQRIADAESAKASNQAWGNAFNSVIQAGVASGIFADSSKKQNG